MAIRSQPGHGTTPHSPVELSARHVSPWLSLVARRNPANLEAIDGSVTQRPLARLSVTNG